MIERKFNPNHDPDNGQFTSEPEGSTIASESRAGNSAKLGKDQGRTTSPLSAMAEKPRRVTPVDDRPSKTMTSEQRTTVDAAGKAISSGEGSVESYNTGTINRKVIHSYPNPPAGTITNMTVDDVLSTRNFSPKNPKRVFAFGKHGTTLYSLQIAKNDLGLTGKEKLTSELQDVVFSDSLIPKAGGGRLADFLYKGIGTVDGAQFAASRQWSSIGVPRGMRTGAHLISDGYMSYYGGSANRKATDGLRATLLKPRKG